MDIANSLLTSIFGMSVVFAVLVSLIALIYLQSFVLNTLHKRQAAWQATAQVSMTPAADQKAHVHPAAPSLNPATRPELKLYDTDEKTAALVMAIVCAESDLPANELIFKSIRLIGE